MESQGLTESLRETLAAFDGDGEPRTTSEVAERLDVGRRSTYDRLDRLVERGYLRTKNVGASARVWWRVPESVAGGDEPDWPAAAESLVADVLRRAEVGVFVLDDDYEVAWTNDAAERYFGLDRERALGRDKRELVDERIAPAVEDSEAFADRVLSNYGDDAAGESRFECHVTAGDGPAERWLEHRSRPIESGAYAGGRVEVYVDVTERKRAELSLREQRDQFESLVEAVEEYAICRLDAEGYVRTWNPGVERLKGYEAEEIVGEHFSTFYTEADREAGVPERNLAAAAEEGWIEDEGWRVRADGTRFWANVTITAIRDDDGDLEGFAKVTRDMTERREFEQELQRERDLLERVDDGFFALDGDWRFTYANEQAAQLLDRDRSELVGRNVWDAFPAAVDTQFQREYERARETGESVSFEAYFPTLSTWFEVSAYPSESGLSVYFRDVTERKERERELERYERIVETVDDGIYAVDDDDRFVLVNDAFCELLGYEREDLLGMEATDIYDEEYAPVVEERAAAVAAGEREAATIEFELRRADGRAVPVETRYEPFPYGDGTGRCGVVRDISDRLDRERELQRRVRQQAVVTELGRRALEERDLDALMAQAVEQVATTLDNDYCKVLDLDDDADELLLRQGVGWDEGVVGEATVSAVADGSQAADTLRSSEPVVVEDLHAEERFGGPDLLSDHDVRSGISVVIGSPDDPWGILGTHDTDPGGVSEQDVNFVQSVATILATAINRRRYEERLVRQREQLAALNSLNEVVRGITDAVVDQSTREEIERTVCDHLAAADSYRFAWIGAVDSGSRTVRTRAKAGTDGYLDGVTISVDPDDERGGGPTGRAFRTGEMQVTQDVQASDEHDPWREHVDSSGVRSSAAIPIVHEGTTYGVLNVYAGRPNAFEGQERTVLAQLGEVVGHAIAAAERKQALLSDEVVELEFQIADLFEALEVDEQPGGRFSFDHVVPVGDDEFLVYGTASAAAVDTVERLVEHLPHWAEVSFADEEGDDDGEGDSESDRGFELRMVEPPVLSALASLGGSVEEAVVEDGDYRMTLHVSPTADVRQVIEAVTDAYPQATMLRRQQVTREDARARPTRSLLEGLTDRQRTTLEAAYHAGFFEWPRDASGEDVAESLQVSPPTFHQHLRKAEGKVFGGLFEGTAD